jgi:hypothetical protein
MKEDSLSINKSAQHRFFLTFLVLFVLRQKVQKRLQAGVFHLSGITHAVAPEIAQVTRAWESEFSINC